MASGGWKGRGAKGEGEEENRRWARRSSDGGEGKKACSDPLPYLSDDEDEEWFWSVSLRRWCASCVVRCLDEGTGEVKVEGESSKS